MAKPNPDIYPYRGKIKTYKQIGLIARTLHKANKKIVFVSGCYDIVHLGHARFLHDAKALGDILVVSVASDVVIRQLKGKDRPVMDQDYRAAMLASLIPVDYVVIDEEPIRMPERINFMKLLEIIKPDFFAVNSTDRSIPYKTKLIESLGGKLKVIDVEKTAITSTTEIIRKISSL